MIPSPKETCDRGVIISECLDAADTREGMELIKSQCPNCSHIFGKSAEIIRHPSNLSNRALGAICALGAFGAFGAFLTCWPLESVLRVSSEAS